MTSVKRRKRQHLDRLKGLQAKREAYQAPSDRRSSPDHPDGERSRQALVERLIQEAIDNGEFDNLPGKGKPLNLDQNPYLEPGQELAFGLLQRNGFAPEWIERGKEIRRELELAQQELRLAWRQHRIEPSGKARWLAAQTRFEERLVQLNRKIDSFNLVVPVVSLQRSRLRPDIELRRVQQEARWK